MKLPNDSMTPYLKNPFLSSSYTAAATRYYQSVAAEMGPHAYKGFVYPIDEPHAKDMPLVRKYTAFMLLE